MKKEERERLRRQLLVAPAAGWLVDRKDCPVSMLVARLDRIGITDNGELVWVAADQPVGMSSNRWGVIPLPSLSEQMMSDLLVKVEVIVRCPAGSLSAENVMAAAKGFAEGFMACLPQRLKQQMQ
jgi:hypothetical protein